MSHHDPDDDRVLPRVCDPANIPRAQADATPSVSRYVEAVQQRDGALDPVVRHANEQAYRHNINRLLQSWGLSRERITVTVEPAVPERTSGGITIIQRLRRLLGGDR